MNELITAVLNNKEGGFLGRVNPLLLSPKEKEQVEWIQKYVLAYGKLPELERFKKEFKFFVEVSSKDPTSDIFDRTVATARNVFFKTFVNDNFAKINSGTDPAELIEKLVGAMTHNQDSLTNIVDYDRTRYFTKINSISFGVDLIDKSIGGLVDGDLVFIVGRPGSGKTTLMDWMVTNWALIGKTILYISNENSSTNVVPKLDSIFGGFNPIKHRTREWENGDKEKIAVIQHVLRSMGVNVIVPESPAISTTQVAALIEETQPDIIVIDGVYLMSEKTHGGERDWKDAAAVSTNLKRLARKVGKPIIGVIQASKEAEGTNVTRGTIAHTDAYLQDADGVISVNFVDGKTTGQVIKSRWGTVVFSDFFSYTTNFDNMFITLSKVSSDPDEDIEDVGEDW